MLITPISHYSYTKQNKVNYQTVLNRSCKTDSLSFGACVTKTIDTMPKIEGLADLSKYLFEMVDEEELSRIQTDKLKEIFESAMQIIKDDIDAGNPKKLIKVIVKDQNPEKSSITYDCARGFLDTEHKYNSLDSLGLSFNRDGSLFSCTHNVFGLKQARVRFEDNKVIQIQKL